MSMSPWIPLAGGLVNMIVLALVGLAVVGKFRWRALEEYEKLSEARGERIAVMEVDQRRYAEETAAKHRNYENQIDTLMVSIEALRGTVAQLERNESDTARRNVDLQRQLEASKLLVQDLQREALARTSASPERRAASAERESASQERDSASQERIHHHGHEEGEKG